MEVGSIEYVNTPIPLRNTPNLYSGSLREIVKTP